MKPTLRSFIIAAVVLVSMNLQAQELVLSNRQPADTVKVYSVINTDLSSIKDKDKPASVVKIDLTQEKYTNERSVLEFLQGRISGLDINSVSNGSMEGIQAILRGQNFKSNQTPLIVIDGIPQQSMDNLFSSDYTSRYKTQSLIDVPLADIESIEVLKDGASTALYGADGANGVILIETKKGRKQKLSLSYQFNQSFVKRPSYLPMLNGNEFRNYQLEAWHNTYGSYDIPYELAGDRDNPNYYNYSANTDWMKAVTQAGRAGNHHLSFSGGNEKNRLYGSVGYLDEKGTTINTGTNQLQSRLNFEHYFSRKFTLAFNLSYGNNKNKGTGLGVQNVAFKKAPYMSIWEYDAEGNPTGEYFDSPTSNEGFIQHYGNPVAVSENGDALNTKQDLMFTTHFQYIVNKWLRFRETLSYNNVSNISKINFNVPSQVGDTLLENQNRHILNDRKYEHMRHEIHALVKIPFKREQINSLNATFTMIQQEENFSEKYNATIGQQILRGSESNHERSKIAAVSSIVYKLFDRYILMVNARLEDNSEHHMEYYLNKFSGASLAWRFSDEPFLQFLKLNKGLVHAGISFSDYRPEGGFSTFTSVWGNNPFNMEDFFNQYINTDTHTQSTTYDAGLELGLFGNRLQLSADYYYQIPEIKNMSDVPLTMLEMNNKGWEGAIDYAVISQKDFSWSVQFNIAHNEQRVVKALDGIKRSPFILSKGDYGSYVIEGKPLGAIYGLVNEGVYSSDQDAVARDKSGNVIYSNGAPRMMQYQPIYTFKGGDTKFRDVNADGFISDADLVYLGNANPDFTGGFGSTVRFKNLSFTCNFHYRTGHKVINQTALNTEGLNPVDNLSIATLNRWRVQGQQEEGLLPRAYINHPANYSFSDRYVESGSFVSLNYLNLGYAFDPTFCKKIHVKELALHLSGQRLYTYSRYSGLNAETGISNNWLNIDQSIISLPEVYTVGVRVTI